MSNTNMNQAVDIPMTNMNQHQELNKPLNPQAQKYEPASNAPIKSKAMCEFIKLKLCAGLLYAQSKYTIEEETSAAIRAEDFPVLPDSPPDSEGEVNWSARSPSSPSSPSSHSSDWNVSMDCVSNSSGTTVPTPWLELDEEASDEPKDAYDPTDPDEMDVNLKFEPKFKGNPAKGNFFISKEMITQMMSQCNEPFITANALVPDEKLAFDYFKQSVAMQINDGQILIHRTTQGKRIIIDIDLSFAANGQTMYLIAMLNARDFRDKVKWQISAFGTAHEIVNEYGIYHDQLPRSSRQMHGFQRLLSIAPTHVPIDVVYNTTFHKLPGKKSRRNGEQQEVTYISE
eukprot:6071_1